MKELYAKVMADEGTPPDFKSQLDGLYAKLSGAAPTLVSIRPEDPEGEIECLTKVQQVSRKFQTDMAQKIIPPKLIKQTI